MAFRFFNPNPAGKFVGDCTIRGICKLLNKSWDEVYAGMTFQGFVHKDMPSGNSQYSGHDMDRRPFREYQITSYRAPHGRMSYDGRSYGHYYDSMDRSMNNGMNYYSDPYSMGYSGHSIGDRAVSLMEGMFDDAKTDYERKQVGRFIEMIRAASQQMQ